LEDLMETDIPSLIGAVTREVTSRERDGREARVVVASRTYPTSIDDVWEAITSPERIPRWFLPVSGDLRLGGRYQLEGNASGEIVACEPPRQLSVTWEFGGEVSWLSIRLSAGGDDGTDGTDGTRLELEHSAHVDDRWGEFGPGAVGVGWDLALYGLAQHLVSGADLDPEEAQAWAASDDGKLFIRLSSDDWGRASVAAGADESAAAEAAGRTTAAYTGEGGHPGDG
jgi:uncharacterized protein YndB with AHSA1/START domain